MYTNYPVPFSTVYAVSVSMIGYATGTQSCAYVDDVTNTNFRSGSHDPSNGMKGIMWVAFGLA